MLEEKDCACCGMSFLPADETEELCVQCASDEEYFKLDTRSASEEASSYGSEQD